jgi:hypothetical protein
MFRGEAYIVRYADDSVMLFQYKSDADKMYEALPKRMAKFGLELAMDKTKILPFGRFAKQNSKDGKTETFDFLGFTFSNGTTRNGKYRVELSIMVQYKNARIYIYPKPSSRLRSIMCLIIHPTIN